MNQRKYVLVLSYHVAAREREIREGETKFLYNMKLVPPKVVGFREFRVSKCRKLSM